MEVKDINICLYIGTSMYIVCRVRIGRQCGPLIIPFRGKGCAADTVKGMNPGLSVDLSTS